MAFRYGAGMASTNVAHALPERALTMRGRAHTLGATAEEEFRVTTSRKWRSSAGSQAEVGAYIATLERDIIADHRGTGRLALLVLALIAVLLCLVPLQARFGHDDSRPRELR